ncbi:hypothetical protein F5146DRAFT_1105144 [Armillaria mellea]|nr:hypothetical protein F5146DRAFT_1105144 [Armillaria mellea]
MQSTPLKEEFPALKELEFGDIPLTDVALTNYTLEQYRKLKFKVDCYLLPLMWLCCTMVLFGLCEDTGLIGQQYSWLTMIFYLTYMCFEFPLNIILQHWSICWGFIVLCISFARNFKQLVVSHALQGLFKCCISLGFLLIIGSGYTRGEQLSCTLIFQSAQPAITVISDLILYGIGTLQYMGEVTESWHYMSYFLGSLTIVVVLLCMYFLGTPSEVWKWDQVWECLVDPCFYFSGIHIFLTLVPNGGLTMFGSIINRSFWVTSKWKNLHLHIMALVMIPSFIGFLEMALIKTSASTKWTKWGMYYMTVSYLVSWNLGLLLIPSNIPGHTNFCVGSMCGSQIFDTKYAVIGCSVCFGLDFLIIVAWHTTLVLQNRQRDKAMLMDGLMQEETEMQGKINGESDMTDFKNSHFRPDYETFICTLYYYVLL